MIFHSNFFVLINNENEIILNSYLSTLNFDKIYAE